MTLSDDEVRIVRAVGEMRLRRIARLRSWTVALGTALAVSIASHTCDLVTLRRELDRQRAACVERAP